MAHKIDTCDFGNKTNNTCGSFRIKTKDGRWICNMCYYVKRYIVKIHYPNDSDWVNCSKLTTLVA